LKTGIERAVAAIKHAKLLAEREKNRVQRKRKKAARIVNRKSYIGVYRVLCIGSDRIEPNRRASTKKLKLNRRLSACEAAQRQRSNRGVAEEEQRRHGIGIGGTGAAAAGAANVDVASVGAQAQCPRSVDRQESAVQECRPSSEPRSRLGPHFRSEEEPTSAPRHRKHRQGAAQQ